MSEGNTTLLCTSSLISANRICKASLFLEVSSFALLQCLPPLSISIVYFYVDKKQFGAVGRRVVHHVPSSIQVLLPRCHLVRSLVVADLLLMVLALQIRGLAVTYLGNVTLIFTVVTVCVLESAIRWLVVTSATVAGSKNICSKIPVLQRFLSLVMYAVTDSSCLRVQE